MVHCKFARHALAQKNNNGSTISSSNSSSIASSSTYTSIPDVSSTPKKNASTSTSNPKTGSASSTGNQKTPSLVKPGQIQTSAIKSQSTSKPAITKPTALKPPASSTAQGSTDSGKPSSNIKPKFSTADSAGQSKTLKLKLFGAKEKDKKESAAITASPGPVKKVSNLVQPRSSGLAKPKTTTELKASSKIAIPKKKEVLLIISFRTSRSR
ncbi:unnamed protein product [Haemonchus placei]|uniref:Flocculation protein FLO11-like n=1 Tax=Haemonchus placei TaxID=6290 RepID=A0A0N4WX87_HAEPC|nr:unnamed protein product [Haemonchus placei]